MSRNLRFRYALEPVLLTRQWDLDALMLSLGEQNAAITAQAALEAGIEERIAAASLAWDASMTGGLMQSVDQFALVTRYMGDLTRQARELAEHMAELVQHRDALIDEVVMAKRGVEAAEQHRDEMRALFVQQRLSGDFKIADDQWNTLQSGVAANGI